MRTRRSELKPLQQTQLQASDPQVHAAVSASAGTGKTQVLTSRVLRLLLRRARPESILCLTFTKAAAAEMANRIGEQLAVWVRLKESELGADLLKLGEPNDPETRQQARQLFARVLDCPGGLKVQTIHAFAQSLLATFPAEAGIVPGFQPIEGRAEQELVRRTLADLIADAEERRDSQLIADVQCLSRRLGETGAVDYLRLCADRHEALAAWGNRDAIEPVIRDLIGLPEGSVEDYLAAHCGDDRFDCDLLRAIANANRQWGKPTGLGIVEKVERWLDMEPGGRAAALPDLAAVVFTGSGDLKKVTVGQRNADPSYDDHAVRLAQAVEELLTIQKGARLAADMAAGLRAGQAFAGAYTRAKRSAGVADFNDLIDWTRKLLGKPGMGDWVRYKLDRQVDHILVDEAQDTNAAQWEIVERLVEEFFSGSSEADRRWRTMFVVGDFKQSIYRFQGTDPEEFEQARAKYKSLADGLREAERSIEAAEERAREFRDLSIDASFRSAQPILDVVDSAIAELGHPAIGLPSAPGRHIAHHKDRPGKVELWQPFEAESDDEGDEGEEGWVDLKYRLYADRLAERVKSMIDEAPVLASTERPLAPGDILILVRSRSTGELASLVVARLFARGVPVAGVDRLHLHDPLAVQDLLAAVRFAVQPNDDLSLANLLVSPLIGWDQDQLRELAYGRDGPLWRELRRRSGESEALIAAHEALSELLAIADFTTPSRFLETILSGRMQGRRKLYARLGTAARDPIDELMNSAIEFERGDVPSLDRFLAWFSRGEVDVQRDPGARTNEVRVMTVHGAKGLQSPLVILADSTADPAKLGRTPLTLDFDIPPYGKAPLLRPKKEERLAPFAGMIEDEEERDLQEHWRLLYVALTRAADRLIVAGIAPKAKKDGSDPRPQNCWHRVVQRALVALAAAPVEEGGQVKLVYGSEQPVRARPQRQIKRPRVETPHWAISPAPPEARPPRPLAPSAMAEDRQAALPPSPEQRAAAERGTIIHALLERLPPVAPAKREQAALRWLEQSAGIADAGARAEIAETVCALIADSRFSALFGPDSLGEAPIAATLADGRVIAGTVDRLLVEPERVLVVDYKTGRAPATEAEIPEAHRLQMGAYAQALSVIFPGRDVEAALLYTANARFFPVGS